MANSFITIEFTAIPEIDDYIGIDESVTGFGLNEIFKAIREENIQTEIPSDLATEFISQNYKDALEEDYNSEDQFTIEVVNGTPGTGLGIVTITANFPNAVFSLFDEPTFATITITNIEVPPPNAVSPESFDFYVDAKLSGAAGKVLNITAVDESWTIYNDLPEWLQASAMSGTGSQTVTLTPVNYNDLDTGTLDYNMTVTIGTETFIVPITLNVLSNVTSPFIEGNIYFTESEDYIQFLMDTTNTYIQLNIGISVTNFSDGEVMNYDRSYNLPLFKGKAEFHVGSIVNDLFEELKDLKNIVNSFTTNYIVNQYKPAEVSISFQEKAYGTYTGTLSSGTLATFKMAKGNQPFITTTQLCLLTVAQQEVTRITPGAPIATSFVFFGSPRIIVMKNNKIIEDFVVPEEAGNYIFSYYRFTDDLKPGDSIELVVIKNLETRSQRFMVMPHGLERTFFLFENNNKMIECFEFTGRRRITSNITNTKKNVVKKLLAYDTKAFSKNMQSMTVNSGQLTKNEHQIITALCMSPNVWCSLDKPEGPYFKVDATSTKIENEDTSSTDDSLDVEFNILEKAHVNIYPR